MRLAVRFDHVVDNADMRLTNMEVFILVKSDVGKFEIPIARSSLRFD